MITGKGFFVTAIALLLGWGGAFAQCDSTITKTVDPLTGKATWYSDPITYKNKDRKYLSTLSVGGGEKSTYLVLGVESEFDLVCFNKNNDKAFLITDKKQYPLIHTGATNCKGIFLAILTKKNQERVLNSEVNGIRMHTNGRVYDFVLTEEQCKHLVCRLDAITGNYGK